jgi:hypothetical protein
MLENEEYMRDQLRSTLDAHQGSGRDVLGYQAPLPSRGDPRLDRADQREDDRKLWHARSEALLRMSPVIGSVWALQDENMSAVETTITVGLDVLTAGAAVLKVAGVGLRGGVMVGEAGAYAELNARRVVGDMLTPHHMPQAALGFTSYGEGGALVMKHGEHMLTRTFGGRGAATALADRGLDFRTALARDIRDVRKIVGPKYDPGLRVLVSYYRTNHPNLLSRPPR